MSAVRKAIMSVLSGPCLDEFVLGNEGTDDLVERLVEAVERVPVTVTIRDLDMEPENVISIIDSNDLWDLRSMFGEGYGQGEASIAVDRGYLKVKVGNGSWSRPIPTSEYEG
jgi:hypothetical protein